MMMNEKLHGVGARLHDLKMKLEAREGKVEYKENCKAIKAEIARLEEVTLTPQADAE